VGKAFFSILVVMIATLQIISAIIFKNFNERSIDFNIIFRMRRSNGKRNI